MAILEQILNKYHKVTRPIKEAKLEIQ